MAVYNQGIFLEEDEILWRGVCQGFFELSAIDKEAKIIHDRMSDYESRAAFSAPWRLYHDTFDSNDSEFASALYSSFKANVLQISVGNADGAICILRDLGRTELASELVAYFLASRSDDLVFDSSNLFRPIEDTEFAKAVSLRLADKVDDRTLIDILLHIVKNSGWGPAEEKKLASCTTEDYYSAFKEYRDELLTSVVQVPLTYGFKDAQIRERATAALKRIAEESALNRLRVIKKFGIDL